MSNEYEQITIKAGELSWEEWQPHIERMRAITFSLLIYNSKIAVSSKGMWLTNSNAFFEEFFPIDFKEDFTYTPVYPLERCTSVAKPKLKPLLKVGRVFHAWEELEELVEAWKLTDEKCEYCFEDADGFEMFDPITQILGREAVFPFPWTLIKMPDVEGVPSEGIDDLEALANKPLKHYVWVEGNRLPVKSHDTHEQALQEALRLSEKERKRVFVITAVVEPVFTPQIVKLGE